MFPTCVGRLSRVAVTSALPRRTASPYGPPGMTESATTAVRDEAGLEQPVIHVMQSSMAEALGRTRRDIPAFLKAATFRGRALSKRAYPPPGFLMIAPLLASLLLVVQNRPPLDSATVARVLSQLRTSDSAVCALAGEALTNYGGFWGHAFADPGMPMPQPMPTPMPMPGGGGGGFHVNMHGRTRDLDPAVLRAFRAVIRDDNRCVRNIAARVLGNRGGSEMYDLFLGLLRDPRADLRETGALGLGEVEDSRAIGPLSDALGRDESPAVRMTAAWALGEIEDKVAIDPLTRALGDRAPDVRRTAAWALGEIEDGGAVPALAGALKDSDPEVRVLSAWALGEIEDAQAVEPLVAALKDSDEEVRATAAWALGQIESPRARDGLTAAQRDEVGSVRRAATWALRQIDDNDDDHDVRVRVRPRVKVKP